MTNRRTVTVIIVSYHSADLTIECLRSLELQKDVGGISLTALVIDNASGDAPDISAAILHEKWNGWVTLIVAPRNGGFAYGNNLGFAYAYQRNKPDYFHLLNPDTRVLPGAIAELVNFLDGHPNAGIAGSSFENDDGSDWPIAFRFPTVFSEIDGGLSLGLLSRLLKKWSVVRQMTREPQPIDWGAGASMLIRSTVLDAVGGFDDNFFLYFEETEFCWRAKAAGFAMWYVPSSRVVHIGGQSTKVTERNVAPRRLPQYWFESRRRYFISTGSMARAIAVDISAILANAVGTLRLKIQGRSDRLVPHYLSDLWRNSVLHRRNRNLGTRPYWPARSEA